MADLGETFNKAVQEPVAVKSGMSVRRLAEMICCIDAEIQSAANCR
jgi:hypothetical protein